MIRCLVIDDEPLALKQLSSYIKKVPFLQLTAELNSATQAQALLDNEQVDAIFVDINMPDLNGLDFVRSLTNPPIVVFTTAYSEYAIDAYKVNAVDYLLKPFGLDEFKRVADKVKKYYEIRHAAEVSKPDEDDAIFVKTDYKIVRVNLRDILYIEAMSEYLRIYTNKSQHPIVVLLSMKKMEERLPSNMFMRIHRSYIINLKNIIEVNKNHVLLPHDASLPIGDLYKEAFNNYLGSKFLSR